MCRNPHDWTRPHLHCFTLKAFNKHFYRHGNIEKNTESFSILSFLHIHTVVFTTKHMKLQSEEVKVLQYN